MYCGLRRPRHTAAPATALHHNSKETGEHLSYLLIWPGPPERPSWLPRSTVCFLTLRYLGKQHSRSLAFKSVRIWHGAGLCGSWSCTAGRLGIPERRPDGWEWVRVTGPTTLIKNGLVSLLSETLLLGLCEFPGCRGTELTERDWLR